MWTVSACDVCQRPWKGAALPRDPDRATRYPLTIDVNEEQNLHRGESEDVLLHSWRICIDCRPMMEGYIYQTINGLIQGARRTYGIHHQTPAPKIKRRKK